MNRVHYIKDFRNPCEECSGVYKTQDGVCVACMRKKKKINKIYAKLKERRAILWFLEKQIKQVQSEVDVFEGQLKRAAEEE